MYLGSRSYQPCHLRRLAVVVVATAVVVEHSQACVDAHGHAGHPALLSLQTLCYRWVNGKRREKGGGEVKRGVGWGGRECQIGVS